MTDEKIISSDEAKRKFIQLRNKIEKIVETAPVKKLDELFAEEFSRIITEAVSDDPICQDYLGYVFKHGKPDLVPENIDLSMKWLILAAANGNNFSIDRLAIFLNYAYDEIVYQPDFGTMKGLNDIDEYNYTYIIGRLICDFITDDLKINAFDLIKEVPDVLEFNRSTMRVFDLSRDKAIKIVLRYLRGYNPKDETGDVSPIVEEENEDEVNSSLNQEDKEQEDSKKKVKNKSTEKKADLTKVFKKEKSDNNDNN